MTPAKCPGCGGDLRPEMLACPNCPLSFPEDDRPAAGFSRDHRFLLPLVFAAAGAAIWYWGAGLIQLASGNIRKDSAPAEDEGTLVITRESSR